jgi:hypothetical protein
MMVAHGLRLTPTERRFLKHLSDGKPHPAASFVPLLNDDLGSLATVRCHLKALRSKLRGAGREVVCEVTIRGRQRATAYRLERRR